MAEKTPDQINADYKKQIVALEEAARGLSVGAIKQFREELSQAYRDLLTNEEASYARGQERLKIAIAIQKESEAALDAAQRQAHIEEDVLKALKDQALAAAKLTEETKAASLQFERHNKLLDAAKFFASDIKGQFFGINSEAKKIGEALFQNNKKVGNLNELFKRTKKLMLDSTNQAEIMGSVILKAYEGGKTALAGLNNQLKAFGKFAFTDPIEAAVKFENDIRLAGQEIGFTLEQVEHTFRTTSREISDSFTWLTRADINKAYLELYKGSTQFALATEDVQIEVQRLATVMTRTFSLPAAKTGQLVDKLVTTFGKGHREAATFAGSLGFIARRLKMDVNVLTDQFLQTMDKLVVYNLPNANKEFLKLAEVQKQTGIEMNSLLGAFEKFSTFEGAADAAATLNAAFGLNISSIELMETYWEKGPIATMELLKTSFDNAGVSIENMNGPFRKLAGQIIGGGDVAQGMKILSMDTEKLRKIQQGMAEDTSFDEVMKKYEELEKKGSAHSQRMGKVIDQGAIKAEWAAQKFMSVMESMAETMASSQMLMMAGMIASLSGGIAQMVALWWLYARQAKMAQMMAMGGRGPGGAGMNVARFGAAAKGGMGAGGMLLRGVGGAAIAGGAGYAAEEFLGGKKEGAGAAVNILGKAGGGALMGSAFGPVGTIVGGIGGALYGIGEMFMAPGSNQPMQSTTRTTIGEGNMTEYIKHSGGGVTTVLSPGDEVTREAPGATSAAPSQPINLAVHLPDGQIWRKTIETHAANWFEEAVSIT